MDILKPPQVDEEEEGNVKASDLTVFASNSTLHGISHVFLPGGVTPRRVFWACAFLASLGCFLFQVADRISYYTQYHHVTTLDETESSQMVFPAVSICNYNGFRLWKLTSNDLYWMSELLGLEKNLEEVKSLLGITEKDDSEIKSSFDMLDFYNRTGHSMEDMILGCRYRNRECGPQNFSEIYTRFGKCYTFNSGKDGYELLYTLKGGTGNGLELMMDIQQDEYIPVYEESEDVALEAGVMVQIHTQKEPPFIEQLGFGVAPGFQTFVSCQQQQLTYLPPPWGDCRNATDKPSYFDTYSITACRIDCETKYLLKECKCRMVHMPGNETVCTPTQYSECAESALKDIESMGEQGKSFCVCETPCSLVRFGKELSMVKIPSKSSAKYLAKKYNKTEEYIADNILVLDIFFEALNYETIEQKAAYEVAGLLGDIGGQMGLFIGASILTIMEIFDYLYEVFRDKALGYFQKRKKCKENDKLGSPDVLSNPTMGPIHNPRIHASHCGVARSSLDSHRTCYLVTRL
ncbi:acid-sensing ion channel 1C-like [Pseudophryne corroboree]|uniref:acid-sensing ion channel 1C-like n=1 Tax=Pseudophryne corroboree TaxID=495146 RepID=UPI003081D38F